MLRFYYIICLSVIAFFYFEIRYHYIMKSPSKHSDAEKYNLVRYACRKISKTGRITNKIYGTENLPKEGGYIMYPNHQGRYDAVGIILSHDAPCTFVIDAERSKVTLLNEITNLLGGQRLNKSDIKSQVTCISNVVKEVKQGRKYILFPEGGYSNTKSDNSVEDFMPGSFKAAIKSRAPIVPVALIDSYNLFTVNTLKRATCEIHYLEPIYYDEYKDMSSHEIASMVQSRIECEIKEAVKAG